MKAVAGTHNPLVRGSSPREGIGFIELVGVKEKEPALIPEQALFLWLNYLSVTLLPRYGRLIVEADDCEGPSAS